MGDTRIDRRWIVVYILDSDRERLLHLAEKAGTADAYGAFQLMTPIVEKMTKADLDVPPKRRAMRLGLPPLLDKALTAKSQELGVTRMKVLLAAARILQNPNPPNGESLHQDAESPNGESFFRSNHRRQFTKR